MQYPLSNMKEIIKLLQSIFGRLAVHYSTKLRAETITTNTRLNDTRYGGWLAINIGTANAKVYGVTLQPGEGLSSESICHLNPGDTWQEPIDIECAAPAAIRMLRSLATPS